MKSQGSITIFFTLIMSVLFSMMGSLLLSAKVAAGRTQIAVAADQTLYSAMAKYDRQLFEEYHLLYIDGGYGTGMLQLGKALDEMEQDMSYLLTPNKEYEITGGVNFLQLDEMSGSISGYTLATDCQGKVFWEQVVSYMKETLGLQGISLLTQKLRSESGILETQEGFKQAVEENGLIEDYEDIVTEAEQLELNNESTKNDVIVALVENDSNGNLELMNVSSAIMSQILTNQEIVDWTTTDQVVTEEKIDSETQEMGEKTKDVMDTVSGLKKTSLLQLVLPDTEEVSNWSADKTVLLRNRDIQTGMGYLELINEENTAIDEMLFQEYMIQNLNFYGTQKHSTGPSYGVEWVLFEKLSDAENLKASVNRLFLIREAANAMTLYNDESRYGEVKVLASALAAVLKMPAAQTVFEGAITLAWAFAESVVDVSAMLDGQTVPLVKKAESWQVEFIDILMALEEPETFYRESSGLTYQDYLRLMLLMKSEEKKIEGCMEVIELSMRGISGKEHFSMDCAIDTLEAEFEIRAQNYKTFTITEKRSYRTM